jgi:hypothetical protein
MAAATIPRMIHRWWTTFGSIQAAATASNMAAIPANTPCRAVLGSFIQCREKMYKPVAIR